MKCTELKRRTPISRTGSLGTQSHARLAAAEAKKRTRKCVICRTPFQPRSIAHKACSAECAIAHLEKLRAAKAKAERREGLERLRTRTDHAKLAQKAFNRYVNLRDKEKDCVSCGKPASLGGVRNASHFKSVGSNSALRFHLWNVHTSCYRCNVELSGNLGEYYPRLVERIGAAKVEYLQSAKRDRRYEIEYLQRLKKIFTKKSKRLIGKAGKS